MRTIKLLSHVYNVVNLVSINPYKGWWDIWLHGEVNFWSALVPKIKKKKRKKISWSTLFKMTCHEICSMKFLKFVTLWESNMNITVLIVTYWLIELLNKSFKTSALIKSMWDWSPLEANSLSVAQQQNYLPIHQRTKEIPERTVIWFNSFICRMNLPFYFKW